MKCLAGVAVAFGVLIGPVATVARADISPEDVREAIQKGADYLKRQQHVDGAWPDYLGQPGGVTALCTLALLNAGVEPKDPVIQLALKNLRRRRPEMTYVVSLQTMVLCLAEPEKDQVLIQRNVDWLVKKQIQDGHRAGSWSYPVGSGDGSNTQFALLALHEAERAAEADRIKVQIPIETWQRGRDYWDRTQNADGSWGYYPPLEGTGSMTCAGISSMIITADMIHQADARVVGDKIDCCGRGDIDSDKVENGLRWLAAHFTVRENPNQRGSLWTLYYLYGLERAGRLTARRMIGLHDWYREGTQYLLEQQDRKSGLMDYWKGRGHSEEDPQVATSLALLFLSKGRRPVLLAKVKHGLGEDWNQRRGDVNNLTLYVESKWNRPLTWQVIDIEKASVGELLQVPVLYFAGGRTPLPDSEERQKELAMKLRDYIDRGGFLFAEGDCCATGFDKGFRDLMELVFPEPEYRLRLLDPSHPIWQAEQKVPADQLRPLEGVDFGCRTSVVYAKPDPADGPRPSLSCLWELSRSGRGQKFSKSVQDQIDAGRAIGINILAYATNREIGDKPINVVETGSVSHDKIDRGKIIVAKLRHPGACDAAPRALANLMEAAGRELKIRADVRPTMLNITDAALFDYPLVFMHGRNSFRLTDQERARLKQYIERGGMLFADSVCASKAFTESFRREMATIFPQNALQRIPSGAPIWTTKYGGFDLSTVTRRDPQPASEGGPLKAASRQVPPDLEGIKFGDRYGVIFSEFDLSCALEKHDSLECRGYTREDAARIGLNVLLYAAQQ